MRAWDLTPSIANSDPEVSSPVQTWTSGGGDYTSNEQEGSLTQTTTMTLYSSDETYQLVPLETNSFVGDGSALIPTGRTVMTYSANGRELLSQTAYHSEFDSDPATTSYITDTSTGNSVSSTKSEQQASGKSATQTFSGFEVYPSEVYNEKNHRLRSFRDVATGQVTRTLAPNVMDCASGSSQYEGGETVYDGFGRPLEVYQYGCDSSNSC